MLNEIEMKIPEFVAKAKDKDDPFRLMVLAIASTRTSIRARP